MTHAAPPDSSDLILSNISSMIFEVDQTLKWCCGNPRLLKHSLWNAGAAEWAIGKPKRWKRMVKERKKCRVSTCPNSQDLASFFLYLSFDSDEMDGQKYP